MIKRELKEPVAKFDIIPKLQKVIGVATWISLKH